MASLSFLRLAAVVAGALCDKDEGGLQEWDRSQFPREELRRFT